MSGRFPSRIGAYDNACEFPAAVPTSAHYLRDAGYYTCIAGKMHFLSGRTSITASRYRLDDMEIYPADFSWVPPRTYDELEVEETAGKGAVALGVSSVDTVADAGPLARSQQIDYDEEVARRATQHIYDWRRYGDGRPLFMTVSFTQPHDPYVITRDYWNLYTDEEIDPPLTPAIPLDQMDPHSRSLYYHYSLDRFEVTDEVYRRARHGYYGMISYIDAKLGELRKTLEAAGIADDTIIVFTSDHGDMVGERGLWFKKNLFDPAIRVPLIIHRPGRRGLPRVTAPVSLVDLLPTLNELAGREAGTVGPTEGLSLVPLLGEDDPGRLTFAEHLDGATVAPRVMLRKGRYKIVHSEAYPTQLFDLEADPRELDDLAGDPGFADVLADMMDRVLATWDLGALRDSVMASQRARRFIDGASRNGRRRDWEHYPDPIRRHTKFVRTGERFPNVERRSYLPYGDQLKDVVRRKETAR